MFLWQFNRRINGSICPHPPHQMHFSRLLSRDAFIFSVCICFLKWVLLQKLVEIANWISSSSDVDTNIHQIDRNCYAVFIMMLKTSSFNHTIVWKKDQKQHLLWFLVERKKHFPSKTADLIIFNWIMEKNDRKLCFEKHERVSILLTMKPTKY